MRWWSRLAVLTCGVAAALTFASPSNANAQHQAEALAAVSGLADARAAIRSLPADFSQVMGYEPETAQLADGSLRVINPAGSCSVPGEGRPYDFSIACQAHDFGYDLLRFAERKEQPLPGWARDEIDALLTRDLLTQCSTAPGRAACEATVGVFVAAVTFNSWRQVSGPPIDSSGMPRTAGLVLLAGVGLGTSGLRLWRRLRLSLWSPLRLRVRSATSAG